MKEIPHFQQLLKFVQSMQYNTSIQSVEYFRHKYYYNVPDLKLEFGNRQMKDVAARFFESQMFT